MHGSCPVWCKWPSSQASPTSWVINMGHTGFRGMTSSLCDEIKGYSQCQRYGIYIYHVDFYTDVFYSLNPVSGLWRVVLFLCRSSRPDNPCLAIPNGQIGRSDISMNFVNTIQSWSSMVHMVQQTCCQRFTKPPCPIRCTHVAELGPYLSKFKKAADTEFSYLIMYVCTAAENFFVMSCLLSCCLCELICFCRSAHGSLNCCQIYGTPKYQLSKNNDSSQRSKPNAILYQRMYTY